MASKKPWDGLHHGRIPSKPDARDDNFPLRLLDIHLRGRSAPIAALPRKRTLPLAWRGDQGEAPMCVGAAGEGYLRTTPGKQKLSGLTMVTLYGGAQMYDEIPGEGYEGTTTRGLLEFLVKYEPAEDVKSYWWVKTVQETIDWIGAPPNKEAATPVLWGINWYTSMYQPTKEGIISPRNGVVSSGHEVLQLGYDLRRGLLLFQNSWARDWGVDGRFWLSMEDAERLLHEDGEAAVAVKYPKYNTQAEA